MGDKTGIEWRVIPGTHYRVNPVGEIMGPRGLRQPQINADGYAYIITYRRGAGRSGAQRNIKIWVHHAVLLAFVGPRPEGHECRHLNDDRTDNRIENLAWGTRRENAADKIINGRQPRGETSASAKLTEAEIHEIRSRRPASTLRSLAKEYGVSHTAIRRACAGQTWGHVNG